MTDKKRIAINATAPPNGLPEAALSAMFMSGCGWQGNVVALFNISVTKNGDGTVTAYIDAEVPSGQADSVTSSFLTQAVNLMTFGSTSAGDQMFVCKSVTVSPR